MRWALVFACAAVLGPATLAVGQQAVQPDLITTSTGNLWTRQGTIQLAVMRGQIDAAFVGSGQPPVREDHGDQHEELTVDGTDFSGTARYDRITPREHFSIEIVPGDGPNQRIVIRHETMLAAANADDKSAAPATSSPNASEKQIVEFLQSGAGPITLTVSRGVQKQKAEANSLWQLLLGEPRFSDRYLVPMLLSLRPEWQLDATATDARQLLLTAAADFRPAQSTHWAALVAQLADQRFAVRERAERELRSAGAAALPYLQNLHRRDLDAEQWRRISGLLAMYEEPAEDRPETIATRYLGDRNLWLSLLADEQESTRKIATHQLGMLLGRDIVFDATANAEIRRRQLESLQRNLAK